MLVGQSNPSVPLVPVTDSTDAEPPLRIIGRVVDNLPQVAAMRAVEAHWSRLVEQRLGEPLAGLEARVRRFLPRDEHWPSIDGDDELLALRALFAGALRSAKAHQALNRLHLGEAASAEDSSLAFVEQRVAAFFAGRHEQDSTFDLASAGADDPLTALLRLLRLPVIGPARKDPRVYAALIDYLLASLPAGRFAALHRERPEAFSAELARCIDQHCPPLSLPPEALGQAAGCLLQGLLARAFPLAWCLAMPWAAARGLACNWLFNGHWPDELAARLLAQRRILPGGGVQDLLAAYRRRLGAYPERLLNDLSRRLAPGSATDAAADPIPIPQATPIRETTLHLPGWTEESALNRPPATESVQASHSCALFRRDLQRLPDLVSSIPLSNATLAANDDRLWAAAANLEFIADPATARQAPSLRLLLSTGDQPMRITGLAESSSQARAPQIDDQQIGLHLPAQGESANWSPEAPSIRAARGLTGWARRRSLAGFGIRGRANPDGTLALASGAGRPSLFSAQVRSSLAYAAGFFHSSSPPAHTGTETRPPPMDALADVFGTSALAHAIEAHYNGEQYAHYVFVDTPRHDELRTPDKARQALYRGVVDYLEHRSRDFLEFTSEPKALVMLSWTLPRRADQDVAGYHPLDAYDWAPLANSLLGRYPLTESMSRAEAMDLVCKALVSLAGDYTPPADFFLTAGRNRWNFFLTSSELLRDIEQRLDVRRDVARWLSPFILLEAGYPELARSDFADKEWAFGGSQWLALKKAEVLLISLGMAERYWSLPIDALHTLSRVLDVALHSPAFSSEELASFYAIWSVASVQYLQYRGDSDLEDLIALERKADRTPEEQARLDKTLERAIAMVHDDGHQYLASAAAHLDQRLASAGQQALARPITTRRSLAIALLKRAGIDPDEMYIEKGFRGLEFDTGITVLDRYLDLGDNIEDLSVLYRRPGTQALPALDSAFQTFTQNERSAWQLAYVRYLSNQFSALPVLAKGGQLHLADLVLRKTYGQTDYAQRYASMAERGLYASRVEVLERFQALSYLPLTVNDEGPHGAIYAFDTKGDRLLAPMPAGEGDLAALELALAQAAQRIRDDYGLLSPVRELDPALSLTPDSSRRLTFANAADLAEQIALHTADVLFDHQRLYGETPRQQSQRHHRELLHDFLLALLPGDGCLFDRRGDVADVTAQCMLNLFSLLPMMDAAYEGAMVGADFMGHVFVGGSRAVGPLKLSSQSLSLAFRAMGSQVARQGPRTASQIAAILGKGALASIDPTAGFHDLWTLFYRSGKGLERLGGRLVQMLRRHDHIPSYRELAQQIETSMQRSVVALGGGYVAKPDQVYRVFSDERCVDIDGRAYAVATWNSMDMVSLRAGNLLTRFDPLRDRPISPWRKAEHVRCKRNGDGCHAVVRFTDEIQAAYGQPLGDKPVPPLNAYGVAEARGQHYLYTDTHRYRMYFHPGNFNFYLAPIRQARGPLPADLEIGFSSDGSWKVVRRASAARALLRPGYAGVEAGWFQLWQHEYDVAIGELASRPSAYFRDEEPLREQLEYALIKLRELAPLTSNRAPPVMHRTPGVYASLSGFRERVMLQLAQTPEDEMRQASIATQQKRFAEIVFEEMQRTRAALSAGQQIELYCGEHASLAMHWMLEGDRLPYTHENFRILNIGSRGRRNNHGVLMFGKRSELLEELDLGKLNGAEFLDLFKRHPDALMLVDAWGPKKVLTAADQFTLFLSRFAKNVHREAGVSFPHFRVTSRILGRRATANDTPSAVDFDDVSVEVFDPARPLTLPLGRYLVAPVRPSSPTDMPAARALADDEEIWMRPPIRFG